MDLILHMFVCVYTVYIQPSKSSATWEEPEAVQCHPKPPPPPRKKETTAPQYSNQCATLLWLVSWTRREKVHIDKTNERGGISKREATTSKHRWAQSNRTLYNINLLNSNCTYAAGPSRDCCTENYHHLHHPFSSVRLYLIAALLLLLFLGLWIWAARTKKAENHLAFGRLYVQGRERERERES